MSCGNPHETPCTEVLDRVYWYLDGEISDADCESIRQHLDECGPCLREFGLEEAVTPARLPCRREGILSWLPRGGGSRARDASRARRAL